MAYITPNTTVYIMRNIPLDGSYQHTIYFASESAQQNYFFSQSNNKIAFTVNPQSYQRVEKEKLYRLQQQIRQRYGRFCTDVHSE